MRDHVAISSPCIAISSTKSASQGFLSNLGMFGDSLQHHAPPCPPQTAPAAAGTAAPVLAALQLPQLPLDVLSRIMAYLQYHDLAQVRLCSTLFAAAADPLIPGIKLQQWPGQPVSISHRLRRIRGLDLDFALTVPTGSSSCRPDSTSLATTPNNSSIGSTVCPWPLLEAILLQLPKLQSLSLPCWDSDMLPGSSLPSSLAVYLSQLTRLDLDDTGCLPAAVQLPGLKAASFLSNEHTASLATIAALAPNLQQLGCRRLEIGPQRAAAAAQGPEALLAGEPAAVLPHVTHFGGQIVTVSGAVTPAQAAAALGAAFPNLKVLYRVPQVSGDQAGKECGYEDLLTHLPHVTAIRGRNWFSSRSWFLIRSSGQWASDAWRNIQQLSFHSNSYPDGCSDFLDISKSTQLRHLRLTFNYPYTKANELVRELCHLPALECLALPAALLCSRCCPEKHYPGLRSSLETLAAKTQLTRLELLTLPETTLGTSFHCGHSRCVQESLQAFSVKAATIRHQQAPHCQKPPQNHSQVASHSVSPCQHSHVMRQQLQQNEVLQLRLSVEDVSWADESYFNRRFDGHPVWGVYVDAREC